MVSEYWDNARPIISKFNEYGGGPRDEEAEAYRWLGKAQDLAEKGNMPHDLRLSLIDDILEEYFTHNSGFEDSMMALIHATCKEDRDWEHLVVRLREHPSDWNLHLAMEILKDRLHKDKEYLDLRQGRLHYGMDYWDLVKFYNERGHSDKAVRTAEDGLLKGEGRLDELFEFLFDHYSKKGDASVLESLASTAVNGEHNQREVLDRLVEHYRKKGQYKPMRDALLRSFEYVPYRRYHQEYLRLKALLRRTDWTDIEKRIIDDAKRKDLDGYLEICLERKDVKAVLETILDPPRNKWGGPAECDYDRFADRIGDEYPLEMVEYHKRRATYYIELKGRDFYKTAAKHLEEMKRLYFDVIGDEGKWEKHIDALKKKYSNRKAFLEEVRDI